MVYAEARVPWFRSQEYYDSGDWRGTWALDGGGALMNQGVHTADLLRWFCGPVETVYAQARTLAHERIEVEDVVAATLTFANGAVATLSASTALYPGFPVRLAVHGTQGGAIIEGDMLHALNYQEAAALKKAARRRRLMPCRWRRAAQRRRPSRAAPHDRQPRTRRRSGARRTGRSCPISCAAAAQVETPVVDGQEGRKAVELVLAVYESARTGQVVRL